MDGMWRNKRKEGYANSKIWPNRQKDVGTFFFFFFLMGVNGLEGTQGASETCRNLQECAPCDPDAQG